MISNPGLIEHAYIPMLLSNIALLLLTSQSVRNNIYYGYKFQHLNILQNPFTIF